MRLPASACPGPSAKLKRDGSARQLGATRQIHDSPTHIMQAIQNKSIPVTSLHRFSHLVIAEGAVHANHACYYLAPFVDRTC